MKDLAERLLEAHVEHELNRIKDGRFLENIKTEVSTAFKWGRSLKLKDIITPEQILGLMSRIVVEFSHAGGATELAGDMSRLVLFSKQNEKFTLEDIFDRKQFDSIVDKIINLEKARSELIHRALCSKTYANLTSEVLLFAFRKFINNEVTYFANKLPNVSFLINIWGETINKIVRELEINLEKRIKDSIDANIENMIQITEKFLNEFFDESHIIELGVEIWESIGKIPLSVYFNKLNSDDMEDFIIIGYEFWQYFRKSEYFREIYKEIIYHFFEKYGDKELDIILDEMGITEAIVVEEISAFILPAIDKALSIGYLEERLRLWLGSFYSSEKAETLLFSNMNN